MSELLQKPDISPPKSETELIEWLQLIRSRRVGPTTFFRLLSEYGNADAALKALPAIAADAGVKNYEAASSSMAERELEAGRLAGGVLVPFGDPRYPMELAALPDAPPLIWALGNLDLLNRPKISIVGARKATSAGMRMAKSLAKDLAADFIVVSGLAIGIDSCAHEGALSGGTIAVMPGGVDVVYPSQNAVLAQEILEKGLRLSECPPGTVPMARHFVQRNRIIIGLSSTVIVVEAAAKSGSHGTARLALDLGRDVLAVPGHPFDARSSGCNALIREGATLIRGGSDVRDALNHLHICYQSSDVDEPSTNSAPPVSQFDLHRLILEHVQKRPLAEDSLIEKLGIGAAKVIPTLVAMEMDGVVVRDPLGRVCIQ